MDVPTPSFGEPTFAGDKPDSHSDTVKTQRRRMIPPTAPTLSTSPPPPLKFSEEEEHTLQLLPTVGGGGGVNSSSTSQSAFHSADGTPGSSNVLRRSLQERRSGSQSKPLGLCPDIIVADSRDSVAYTGEESITQFRGWRTTEAGASIPTSTPGSFRLMSYNVLASRYTSTDKYPHCPTWALALGYRARNILNEIKGCDPDIICFQEISVEGDEDAELIGSVLRSPERGYASTFLPVTDKTGNPRSHINKEFDTVKKDTEGIAIFYKKDRFELLESYPLRYNLILQSEEKSKQCILNSQQMKKIRAVSHNVALVSVLRDNTSGLVLIVGTVHLFWDSSKAECQVWQLSRLLSVMAEMKEVYDNLGDEVTCILAGDLNSEEGSPAMRYLVGMNSLSSSPATGIPSTTSVDEDLLLSSFADARSNRSILSSFPPAPFLFSSSYKEYFEKIDSQFAEQRQPLLCQVSSSSEERVSPNKGAAVTAVNPSAGFCGSRIDHILYEPSSLTCTSVGKLGPKADIPNAIIPSDHYPVAAMFTPNYPEGPSGPSAF